MKRLRQLCAATALTILLTNITMADDGVMHPWYVPPPPPATKVVSPESTTGEVNTTSEGSTIDLATEITLSLVQSVLALF